MVSQHNFDNFCKKPHAIFQVIILWTANTERFSEVREGLNDTAENLLNSIRKNECEVSPSTIFAVASIQEGVAYINGSPQNTFVPGCIELAEKKKVSWGFFSVFSSHYFVPLLRNLGRLFHKSFMFLCEQMINMGIADLCTSTVSP